MQTLILTGAEPGSRPGPRSPGGDRHPVKENTMEDKSWPDEAMAASLLRKEDTPLYRALAAYKQTWFACYRSGQAFMAVELNREDLLNQHIPVDVLERREACRRAGEQAKAVAREAGVPDKEFWRLWDFFRQIGMRVRVTQEPYYPKFGGRSYLYWMVKRPGSRKILYMAREREQALGTAALNGWVVG